MCYAHLQPENLRTGVKVLDRVENGCDTILAQIDEIRWLRNELSH